MTDTSAEGDPGGPCADCPPGDTIWEDERGHPLPFPPTADHPGIDTQLLNEIITWVFARIESGEILPEDFGAALLSLDDVLEVMEAEPDADHLRLAYLFECLAAHKQGWSEMTDLAPTAAAQ